MDFTSFVQISIVIFSDIELVSCPTLTQPNNGAVTFTPGPNSVSLGVGSVATYSCVPGYDLVGQATRVCQDTSGGSTGTWSGHAPICRGINVKTSTIAIILKSYGLLVNLVHLYRSGHLSFIDST